MSFVAARRAITTIIPERVLRRMKRLVLAGGGHAHLSVLQAFATQAEQSVELVLVTPDRYQYYSGMLPGFMAGHYTLEQCRVDLAPLAKRAGARLVLASVAGMDAHTRCIFLDYGARLEYDLLSLDVGSAVDTQGLDALRDAFLAAKPLAPFFARWEQTLIAAQKNPAYALAVVGAGAAGLELALAAAHALHGRSRRVHLVGSPASFLAGHAPAVRGRALVCLREAGVQWHPQRAVAVAPHPDTQDEEQRGVTLSDGSVLRFDLLIGTTGARALAWLADSGLAVDAHGFVSVNAQHQSTSNSAVFAVGDCCARVDTAMQRSGVHAVRAGPVLARNLRAALLGQALTSYRPRRYSLYLLACGPRYAVASWGPLSAQGAWVWRLKDRIDRGFVQRFSENTG